MSSLNQSAETIEYNTAIKDIAGVQDVTKFYSILKDALTCDNLPDFEILKSLSEIRTEKTRNKVTWAVKKSLLCFLNKEHTDLLNGIFLYNRPNKDVSFAFFYHLNITNRLFREISVNVLTKVYFSGRATISQDDIIPYIREIGNGDKPLWSDNTIYRIATKYLSLLTKIDFVSNGRIKSIKQIRPSKEAQVLFLYFAKLLEPNNNNILTNELLRINFMQPEEIHERLKRLSLKGFFNMNYNGVALNIEFIHSYKGICNALYN